MARRQRGAALGYPWVVGVVSAEAGGVSEALKASFDVVFIPLKGNRMDLKPGPEGKPANSSHTLSQLGAPQQLEAQVQHLERQAVAASIVVLPDVTATSECRQQTMDRGRWHAERAYELAERKSAVAAAQGLANVQRFFERRLSFHNVESDSTSRVAP